MLLCLLVLLATVQPDRDPAALWREAKSYLESHQYADARRVLTQAVKVSPNDPAFWYHLGVSCAELKDADGAIRAFESARKLAPKRPEVYFNLGLAYWSRGEVAKAKDAYRSGLALDPMQPSALQNYAVLLMEAGDYRQAIEPLRSLREMPDLAVASSVSLIECYLKLGDLTEANAETDRLVRSGRASPAEETRLASLLVKAQDPAAAEQLLTDSLGRQPGQPAGLAALGMILKDKRDYSQASQLLQRAVELEPDSWEYAMALSDTLLLWNRQPAVLAFLKGVEPKFGKLPEFQYRLGLVYYGLNKFTESITTLENVLRTNPRRQDQMYYVLGTAYSTTGRAADAEAAYRKAITLNPKVPAYHREMAGLLRKQGPERLEEAITELHDALQLNPSDANLSLQLGICYEQKGDLKNALAPLEEAARRHPEQLQAHVTLARTYFRLGRKAEGAREKQIIAELEAKQQEATRQKRLATPATKSPVSPPQ
jgi:tetratricopeptide (TPR) repeat protein